MNKRIDFTNNGGFPATQYMTKWMQDSYRNAFMGLAGFIGDMVIVSGMDEVGGNVTNGWLTYNGELIPFVGGAIAAGIVVVETPATRLFFDNTSHNVYFEKVAQFGGPATFNYADLQRKESILSMCGEIKMWSGLIAKIPKGWGLADGSVKNIADYPILFANISNVFGGDGVTTFGLPNLKSKFIVGYDPGDADYNTVGNTGGEKSHTLIKAELPAITLDINASDGNPLKYGAETIGVHDVHNVRNDVNNANGNVGFQTEPLGSGDPHNNVPPFFTVAYIIKLK